MELLSAIAALGLIAAPAAAQDRTHSRDTAYGRWRFRNDSERRSDDWSDPYDRAYNGPRVCRDRYSSHHRRSYHDRQNCERWSYGHSRYSQEWRNDGNYSRRRSNDRPHG